MSKVIEVIIVARLTLLFGQKMMQGAVIEYFFFMAIMCDIHIVENQHKSF